MAQPQTHIAFFGHDSADAANRRRVQAFQDDGLRVTGYMMHRRDPGDLSWENVDLGETQDSAFVQRIRSIFSGASVAAGDADRLRSADVIYARNLDMLALAFLTKRKLKLDLPVIYESLDVHRMLSRTDLIGRAIRSIEHQTAPDARPLHLGWVGNLRCKRSLDLLAEVADKLGDKVHIHLHGIPARTEIPVFEPVIDARPNMTYHGRYKSPEDLSSIYENLDVVWAGDFMEAGHNSVWLLPNRIYEGGYYGVPSIAPTGTQRPNRRKLRITKMYCFQSPLMYLCNLMVFYPISSMIY